MHTLNTIHGDLKRLNERQLDAVAAFIADLLSEPEEAEPEPIDDGTRNNGNGRRPRAAGHVELKMIGKNGPYAYLRYWEGKHLRSKYIGKVKNI